MNVAHSRLVIDVGIQCGRTRVLDGRSKTISYLEYARLPGKRQLLITSRECSLIYPEEAGSDNC
jgi:hypothetical protein